MRFRKRHVPTEPIKGVHFPNTGIGGFKSQCVSQRRTVTAKFLSVRYVADIASNCWARGFRSSASLRSTAWLRDLDVSKKMVPSSSKFMASKVFTNFANECL
jgi:hypothetical protein